MAVAQVEPEELKLRFVWHPDVHHIYGQYLTFFIIRVAGETPEEALSYISEYFARTGLRSWNAYALFGEDDVLVRLWSSLDHRQRFREHLIGDRDWHVQQIDCDSVTYMWGKQLPDTINHSDLPSVAPAIEHINALGMTHYAETEEYLRLAGAGLIKTLPIRSEDWIKVYLVIGIPFRQLDDAIERLSASIQAIPYCEEPSLNHSASGMVVLKFAVRRYVHIYQALKHVRLAIGRRSEAKTLLVASATGSENDVIEQGGEPLSSSLTLLSLTCGDRVSVHLPTADRSAKHDLQSIYAANVELFARSKDCRGAIDALTAACVFRITGAHDDLATGLGELWPRLEGCLHYLVPRWAAQHGSTWYRDLEVPALLSGAGVIGHNGLQPTLDDASLGQMLVILGKIASKSEPVGAMVTKCLGQDWREVVQWSVDARNDALHGRVVSGKTEMFTIGKFNEWVPRLLAAVKLFIDAQAEQVALMREDSE